MMSTKQLLGAACAAMVVPVLATAQTQVVVSGATLFRPAMNEPYLTNDFIDVDGDGRFGFDPIASGGWFVDQLAPDISAFDLAGNPIYNTGTQFSNNAHWISIYRGVGSVNGIQELINFQGFGTIPTSIPSERGYVNRREYAGNGVLANGNGTILAGTSRDETGLPSGVALAGVDIAVADVPSAWALQGPSGSAAWNRKPGESGYGQNPFDAPDTGFNLPLPSATLPAGVQLFDTNIAYVPVAILVNRGVGLDHNNDGTIDGNINATDLQHAYVTGRMASGENLVVGGRSAGSGTRNAISNSLGVDPAFFNGDNVGDEFAITQTGALGTGDVGNSASGNLTSNVEFQPSQAEGSSGAEFVAQNHRLAISHTGIAGRGDDWNGGEFELANIRKDFDGDNDGVQDNTSLNASAFVRPTVINVIDPDGSNGGASYKARVGASDVNKNNAVLNPDGRMYEFGGSSALITSGDPDEAPGNPTMTNTAARDFVLNIKDSIAAYTAAPADVDLFGTPGQGLGTLFALPDALDLQQNALNPTAFAASGTNLALQSTVKGATDWGLGAGVSVGEYGESETGSAAGLVPFRKATAAGVLYTDGVLTTHNGSNATAYTAGNFYTTIDGNPLVYGTELNARNEVAYDFNNDQRRLVSDIENMMKWAAIRGLGGFGGAAPVAPESGTDLSLEIIADGNGDGNFNEADILYFADGLAMVDNGVRANPDAPATRVLNRKLGFEMVDQQWSTLTGGSDNNFFDVTLQTGNTYAEGYARGDVTGREGDNDDATNPFLAKPGAAPVTDGTVDWADIDYVMSQFATLPGGFNAGEVDWADQSTLGLAAAKYDPSHTLLRVDLSADINGDLLINNDDVDELVQVILGTDYGDANLDGIVDTGDFSVWRASFLSATPLAGWANGDFNGDGVVDTGDFSIWRAAFLAPAPASLQLELAGADWQAFESINLPEPTTAVLMAIGAIGLVSRRRQA